MNTTTTEQGEIAEVAAECAPKLREWMRADPYASDCLAQGGHMIFVSGAGGWWYSVGQRGDTVGTIAYNSNVYPSLSGVVLPALVEVAQRTGDPRWRTLADKAFQDLIRDASHPWGGLRGSKEINQAARGVWLTAGWRAARN